MKKLILLLFIPLVSFGQEITVVSVEDEPIVFSQETIDYLTNDWSQLSENPQLGLFQSFSALAYFDFNEDGFKDLVATTAFSNYAENIICIFFWDESTQKYIENNQYMMLVQGEAAFWDDSIGDFNGDGLNDVYVPVSNYHGQQGQQPDYYPENTNTMPGHLFLNNGNGFNSQYIDYATHSDGSYPNYERGFVLDIDDDNISDIIVPSVNQHPENTPANNFLATKYNVSTQNEITNNFVYQWEDTYNTSSGFFMQSHSVVFSEYNDKIYILYSGNETQSSNGFQYATLEVSVYSKEVNESGDFILFDKFRLERGDDVVNQDAYVNRETFYINDIDGDGDEEFVIQMYTIDTVPHAGLHVFDHTGQEITQDWFIEDAYLGHTANGFYCEDLNNDGYKDLIMVDIYTENEAETVIYLNNGDKFIQKTIELNGSGWCYPVDVNNDGLFELLKFDVAQTQQTEVTFGVDLNYLDYSNALSINNFENDIKVYPNPSFDYININADSNLEAVLYDSLGKELIRENVTDKLDISTLEKGIYILNLSDGVNTSTHKIIKE